jgi:hypothetical protein
MSTQPQRQTHRIHQKLQQQNHQTAQSHSTKRPSPHAAFSIFLTYSPLQAQVLTKCAQTSDPVSKHTAVVVMLKRKARPGRKPISPTSKIITTQASISHKELFQGPPALSHVPASFLQNRVVQRNPSRAVYQPQKERHPSTSPDFILRGRLYRSAIGARRRRVKDPRSPTPRNATVAIARRLTASHESQKIWRRLACCFFLRLYRDSIFAET